MKARGREVYIIAGVIGVVIIVAWYFLLFSPQRDDLKSLDDQISANESALSQAQQELARLQSYQKTAPQAEVDIVRVSKMMPEDEAIPSMIVELTKTAERAGADAALVVTPYYNKPPERGLIEHFRAVAAATDLPVLIYNIPGRSGVNLSAAALATLAHVENIVAVKQANPDLEELDRVCAIEGFGVYAGNDDMLLDVLRRGGRGGICVASHVVGPRMAELARLARAGDEAGAAAIDDELRPLYKALFVSTNPIPVKEALNLLGHEVGGLRLPLVPASDEERAVVADALQRLGVLAA